MRMSILVLFPAVALAAPLPVAPAPVLKERAALPATELGEAATAVAFTPDDKTLAIAGYHGKVGVWVPSQEKRLTAFSGHASAATCVAFAPAGGLLASGSWDGTVRVWEA